MKRNFYLIISLWVVLITVFKTHTHAQNLQQISKVVPSDRLFGDSFGQSVAIDGDYAIVGAPDKETNTGAAYIFKRSTNGWTMQQKLAPADIEQFNYYGFSVSISGNYVLIGASGSSKDALGTNQKENAGAAYVFKLENNTWVQQQKLVANDRDEYSNFGHHVSISGNYAIIGAKNEARDAAGINFMENAGAAYIFKLDNSVWSQQQKLVANNRAAFDEFGYRVSINGNHALITAPRKNSSGGVYVYNLNNGIWLQQQILTGNDSAPYDEFGSSISLNEDYALIGAIYNDEDAASSNIKDDAGAAYVFRFNDGIWTQQQKLAANDRTAYDNFGGSVSINNGYAAIGADVQDTDAFGTNTKGNAGAAYIFKLENNNWVQQQKLVANDRNINDRFGRSVSINGDYTIVGAFRETEDATGNFTLSDAGSAYIFGPETVLPIQLAAFNAKSFNAHIQLDWSTLSEQNNNGFILSRSADGKNFTELKQIIAANNSLTLKNYNYNDYSPLKGFNYYKLEQTDLDGKTNLVGIKLVNFKFSNNLANIYPNPTNNEINIYIPKELGTQVIVHIWDILGQCIYTETITVQDQAPHRLNNQKLPTGNYTIQLKGKTRSETSKLMVK